jgi:hypothetical protein
LTIRTVTDETDPDGWPIRYIALTPDVTKLDLATWASTQPKGVRVTVEAADEGVLSRADIIDVLQPQVSAVEVRLHRHP